MFRGVLKGFDSVSVLFKSVFSVRLLKSARGRCFVRFKRDLIVFQCCLRMFSVS